MFDFLSGECNGQNIYDVNEECYSEEDLAGFSGGSGYEYEPPPHPYPLNRINRTNRTAKSNASTHVFSKRGSVICRCCSTQYLKWGRYEGKWRLFDGDSLHICLVNPLNQKKENLS